MTIAPPSYIPRRSFLVYASYAGIAGLIVGCKKKQEPAVHGTEKPGPSALTEKPASSGTTKNPLAAADFAKRTPAEPSNTDLATFVALDESGTLTIVVARSEMGQGVRTSLAMVVADALDLPWSQVKVVQATGDERYGDQNTDGSTSVREQFDALQRAGGLARSMLLLAAAKEFGVPVNDLATESGTVVHLATNRRTPYGELVAAAAKLEVPKELLSNAHSPSKLVGTSVPRTDLADIIAGKAIYGADVTLPGMLYASIERSPARGGVLDTYQRDKALASPGVIDVMELPQVGPPANLDVALAVVATSSWAAFAGRRQLDATWKAGRNDGVSTQSVRDDLTRNLSATQGVETVTKRGDFEKSWQQSEESRRLSRDYHTKYCPHMPMEPLVCTAHFHDGKLEIWAPVQSPQSSRQHLANKLGLKESDVTVHVTLLGGAFGRKGQADFVIEAGLVAKSLQKPVQVIWTREDEIRHGFYRPATAQRIRASVNSDKEIEAWHHRSSFGAIRSTFEPETTLPMPWEAGMGRANTPIRATHRLLDTVGYRSPLRIGWVRAVHYVHHHFAISSFLDELAQIHQRDPIEYFLASLETGAEKVNGREPLDVPRLRAVVERVRSLAGYSPAKTMGFAACEAFGSYVATIVELDPNVSERLRVLRTFTVVDCGRVVHPGHALAQVEGSIVFGLTDAMWGGVNLDHGVVKEGNFDEMQLMRIDACPEIRAEFVASDKPPQGLGEPVVATVAPALCNAIAKATAKRVYELPLAATYRI